MSNIQVNNPALKGEVSLRGCDKILNSTKVMMTVVAEDGKNQVFSMTAYSGQDVSVARVK